VLAASAAAAFAISSDRQDLTISGAGITNNSGLVQNFATDGPNGAGHRGTISFIGGAKAGVQTVFANVRASTQFFDYSTADSGVFVNHSGIDLVPGGKTTFYDNSTAGNATFTNECSKVSGTTSFYDNSSAGTGNFTNNASSCPLICATANTSFYDNSTAASGVFTSNGGAQVVGATYFYENSSGGTAQIKLFGGSLSLEDHNAPGVTIGSLEGNGGVSLGPNRLRIGSNNLSTIFSGGIHTGSGSLEKIGSGTLTLSGTNSHTGGTLISSGTLEVTRDGGLGTGGVTVTTSGATLRLQTGATNNYIADTAVFSIVSGSTADLNFEGPPDTVLALVVDGVVQPAGLYGSAASGAPHQLPEFTGSGEILAATATTPTPTPITQATNLSTRLLVGTGDNVGIGGFIVTGSGPRHLLLRGIGPSLLNWGIPNPLVDSVLELHGPAGFQTLANDNWRDTQEAEIIGTGRAPTNDLESAIVADLVPGAYTAILAGNASTTGIGLVEIFDLSTNHDSRLANISTRGNVGTGDDIMIAGFILGGGSGEDTIIVRGLGPSIPINEPLPDPKLELRNSQGGLMASNDNWMDDPSQASIIQAAGLAPSNNLESAIAATLMPGEYTALLSGVNNGTGVGLVEVYDSPVIGPTPSPTPEGSATRVGHPRR